MRPLQPLPISATAAGVQAVLSPLTNALSGTASYLPLPVDDIARADALRASQRPYEPIDDDIAVVMATSGSTGTPKGAQLTAANLIASIDATHQWLGAPGQWILSLPPHHIAGLQIILRSLYAGYEPLVLPPAETLPTTSRTASQLTSHITASTSTATDHPGYRLAHRVAIAHASATASHTYLSLVPTQLQQVISEPTGFAVDTLSACSAVLVGGAAAAAPLLDEARQRGIRVVTTYGSSETAGGAVYNGYPLPGTTIEFIPDTTDRANSSGHPDGCDRSGSSGRSHCYDHSKQVEHTEQAYEVETNHGAAHAQRADSHNSTPLSPPTAQNPQRVALRGPSVAHGYRNSDDEALAIPGVFRTSDLGYLDDNGALRIVGRRDHAITTGGMKVLPSVVEAAIAQAVQDGVCQWKEYCVLGTPDSLWGQAVTMVVADTTTTRAPQLSSSVIPSRESLPAALEETLRALLPPYAVPKGLIRIDALPLTGPGKVDYHAVRNLILTGSS